MNEQTKTNKTAIAGSDMLCIDLSPEMKKCVDFIIEHGCIVRYEGGFWAEENADLKPGFNGGRVEYYYPIVNFGTNTIKSLIKRNVIIPVEFKTSKHGEYPVRCQLANT